MENDGGQRTHDEKAGPVQLVAGCCSWQHESSGEGRSPRQSSGEHTARRPRTSSSYYRSPAVE
ncbi:unnamed protein product [Ectocarpus sp. CCAP 1310/34]|nr:unnamed protein product [Ectocarpus sp. CCAP 1310/34]